MTATDIGTYQNEQTGLTLPCELVLQKGILYIYLKDESRSLLIWDLQKLSSIRRSGHALFLQKSAGESLECSGSMATRIEEVKQGLNFQKKPVQHSYIPILLFGSALSGLIVLGLLCYFLLLPWAAEKSVALVPVDTEVVIGDQLSRAYIAEQSPGDSATWFANRFIHQLKLDRTYPLRVYVVRSDEINAFALPGGNMVIYSGILNKMNSYEELAALIGHESTHVIRRHSLKSMFRSAASSLLLASLLGDMAGVSAVLMSQANEFKQLDYSRELETEADDHGLRVMVTNKIDPGGMLRLLELLKSENAEMPAMMKYLSTHPDTQVRIDHVRSQRDVNLHFPQNKELKAIFSGLKRSL